jgi:hypothetical protein
VISISGERRGGGGEGTQEEAFGMHTARTAVWASSIHC